MPVGIHHPMGGENPVGQHKVFPLAHGVSWPLCVLRTILAISVREERSPG
jgi:hypothetical protein